MSQNTYGNIFFLHGLESSSKGTKGRYFREYFPEMIIPDFTGSLSKRMQRLYSLTTQKGDLTLVGSSFGGLMASVFALEKEDHVKKIILLAPALNFPDFSPFIKKRTPIPAIVFQGVHDTVTPLQEVKPVAKKIFRNLTFNELDDDHMLHNSFQNIDWQKLIL